MRFLLYPILTLFLFSCGNGRPPAELSMLEEPSPFLPDSSKQRLLHIIEGGWVNEEYRSALAKYGSPMTAAQYGLPEQQMAFDISQLDGDTLVNALGRLHYHEHERFNVIFYRKVDGSTGMRIDEHRNYAGPPPLLNYTIEGKDTLLLLTVTEEKETHTYRFHRQFRRFPESDNILLTAMEHYVNTQLFAGDWSNAGKTVVLKANGTVKNFDVYTRYSISTEEDHPASRMDEISFYNDSTGVTYTFTLKDQQLNLYELYESPDGVSASRGKLVCTLNKR